MDRLEKFNSIVKKYPSHRDELVKGPWKWLKGKRADDNAEGLWRIHDGLYALDTFILRHPGGKEWLELSKVRKPSFKECRRTKIKICLFDPSKY